MNSNTELSILQKSEHLKNPDVCPHCSSVDIEGSSFDIEGTIVTQKVVCVECGRIWEDQYKLFSMRELDL